MPFLYSLHHDPLARRTGDPKMCLTAANFDAAAGGKGRDGKKKKRRKNQIITSKGKLPDMLSTDYGKEDKGGHRTVSSFHLTREKKGGGVSLSII